jgi:hypothetical protein
MGVICLACICIKQQQQNAAAAAAAAAGEVMMTYAVLEAVTTLQSCTVAAAATAVRWHVQAAQCAAELPRTAEQYRTKELTVVGEQRCL